jgi:bacterioferritin (cytochrome b1)
MSLIRTLFIGWHRVLAAFHPESRQRLLEHLCDAYRAEISAVAQFRQHAHRMYYSHLREGLLRIAAEAQAHIPWLEDKIRALGGSLPQYSTTPTMGSNSWECLRRDLEEARRSCINLLAWIHIAEHAEPEIAVGLRRIRKDKQHHRKELGDMLMKCDPYTPPATTVHHASVEQQKHAWLEQYKGEWLDQARLEWKAGGKQEPWAEWLGEQEWRWATELPHRDFEWARHLVSSEEEETSRTGRERCTERDHHDTCSPALAPGAERGNPPAALGRERSDIFPAVLSPEGA